MKTQISIFVLVIFFFTSFTTGIDLSPDNHSFIQTDLIVKNHYKEVIFDVYDNQGNKQPRQVKVVIDYTTPERLRVSDAMFSSTGYKTKKHYVKVTAFVTAKDVEDIQLYNLYSYSFIDPALRSANVSN